MSVETTKQAIQKYLDSKHTDSTVLAEDVIFNNMATGEKYTGPDEVLNMLNYMYHVSFDAHASIKNLICEDSKVVLEAEFIGKHIGVFTGIEPTNKDVRVPFCVVYDMVKDKIKTARIYFEVPALLEQLK